MAGKTGMAGKMAGPALLALALLHLGAPVAWADLAPQPLEAPLSAPVAQLVTTLHLPEIIAVMEAEGRDYGHQLRDEMFPDQGGPNWDAQVARIYDADRLLAVISARLGAELATSPATLAAAQDYFASVTGQKILALEVEARRALLDDATETAAQEALADMEAKAAPRLEALRRFAKANDLIEMNVMGAMNANLGFYRGMAEGGALAGLSEQDMLAEVWGQEAQARDDAEAWLWPYLALAYQPLSDEELQSYQRFSETPEGRALNAALFAAFDAAFVQISRDLGRATARMVQGEDI